MPDYPGVVIKEVDLPTPISAFATGRCVYVVESQKGIANEFLYPTDEESLVNLIGEPVTAKESEDFHVCKEFLRYGNDLVIVRGIDDTVAKIPRVGVDNSGNELVAGVTGGSAEDVYISHSGFETKNSASDNITFYAKSAYDESQTQFPSIKVAMATPADFATANILNPATGDTQFSDEFEFAPVSANGEVALAVLVDDVITERWIVSLTDGAKNDLGENIYIRDFLRSKSQYINAITLSNPTAVSFEAIELTDGDNGNSGTIDFETAYNKFLDKNALDLDYIIDGSHESERSTIINIANSRKDCMAFIGPKSGDIVGVSNTSTIVSNLITDRGTFSSTSYVAYFGNYKKVWDKYRRKYVWINCSVDAAGIKVRTNTERELWLSMAGYNNGQLENASDGLAFNPTEAQQGQLYKNQINHIFNKPGKGTVIFGQKTLLNKNSGFNRINVRDLFIYIEQTIASAAEDYLFEVNDAVTRSQFVNSVEPFLQDIQNKRGIQAFQVVCDETNNPPSVVDANELRARILVKPSKIAEFITLNFYNVPSGVDFEEAAQAG